MSFLPGKAGQFARTVQGGGQIGKTVKVVAGMKTVDVAQYHANPGGLGRKGLPP